MFCFIHSTLCCSTWLSTREKGTFRHCVKFLFKLACAVCAGYSETTLSVLCTFSVYSKSILAKVLSWISLCGLCRLIRDDNLHRYPNVPYACCEPYDSVYESWSDKRSFNTSM